MTDYSPLIYNLNSALLYLDIIVVVMIIKRKKIRWEFDLRKMTSMSYLAGYFVAALAVGTAMSVAATWLQSRGAPITGLYPGTYVLCMVYFLEVVWAQYLVLRPSGSELEDAKAA